MSILILLSLQASNALFVLIEHLLDVVATERGERLTVWVHNVLTAYDA